MADDCARRVDELLAKPARLAELRAHGQRRFAEAFTWPDVLAQYERLLAQQAVGSVGH